MDPTHGMRLIRQKYRATPPTINPTASLPKASEPSPLCDEDRLSTYVVSVLSDPNRVLRWRDSPIFWPAAFRVSMIFSPKRLSFSREVESKRPDGSRVSRYSSPKSPSRGVDSETLRPAGSVFSKYWPP